MSWRQLEEEGGEEVELMEGLMELLTEEVEVQETSPPLSHRSPTYTQPQPDNRGEQTLLPVCNQLHLY